MKTCVRLTFDDDAFRASFLVLNDPVQGSAYTDCNEPIFRQEVVEMFIGNDTSANPEHYWEIDVAPSGVAWMGYDSNPGGDRRNFSSVAYPCDTVDTRVLRHPTEDAWEADYSFPSGGLFLQFPTTLPNIFRWARFPPRRDDPSGLPHELGFAQRPLEIY